MDPAELAVAEVNERRLELPMEKHGRANRFSELLVGVGDGDDLHHIDAALFEGAELFKNRFGAHRLVWMRRHHHLGTEVMDLADQLFLLFDRFGVAGNFIGGGVVEVAHHVDHGAAGLCGVEQQHLAALVVVGDLVAVVAVEVEHEGKVYRVDDPFERLPVAEFRQQVAEVDGDGVGSVELGAARLGDQAFRRLTGHDCCDCGCSGILEK